MENKELFFRAELVKTDLGFTVRVPENFVEELGLKENELIGVTIKKTEAVRVPKALVDIYKKHMPELSELSEEEFSVLLDFHNREKVSSGSVEELEAELEKKHGKEMLDNYRKFKQKLQEIDKEAIKQELEEASKQ